MSSQAWAPVPGSPAYEVSDGGQVRRLLPDGSSRPLRLPRNSKGYAKVCLGRARQEYVHRLVWLAFRGPIPEDMRVDHIDDRQTHNWLSNLQLLSNADNVDKRWGRWQDEPGWGDYVPRGAEAVA